MPHSKIRIALIALRPILADCLSIAAEHGFEVIGVVPVAEELPQHGPVLAKAEVLLFDGARPLNQVEDSLRWCKIHHPKSRAVAIDLNHSDAVEWIACGLDAFGDTQAGLHQVVQIIAQAVQGTFECPPTVLTKVVAQLKAASTKVEAETTSSLTHREKEVLQLLGERMTNKEIAARLGISVYTVKNHVHNLLSKMEVQRRRYAVRSAAGLGLIETRRAAKKEVYR